MYKNIAVEAALALDEALLVDVRSENEYLTDTMPGAVNIPLLNNGERAAVGLAYHKYGPEQAVKMGLHLVSPKLGEKLSAVDRMACGRKIAVFCWRGGLRSELMALLFDTAGYQVYRVAGGYKAYRRYVNEYLGQQKIPLKAVVLHGLTGVGKTDVLLRLAQLGVPVLDLEGLARHRGSVYGKIGLPPSPSQKAFEGHIVQLLKKACNRGFFVVECESRRVGNLIVPPLVMEFIHHGERVLVYTSLENRVKRIREVYAGGPGSKVIELQKATSSLVKKLGQARVEELNGLLAGNNFDQVISYMLKCHYDPLYNYPDSPGAGFDLCVDTGDMENAVKVVYEFVTGLPLPDLRQ
ncbi:tRNA 2-selenouridine(34) synthase MnmH [Pelotomaculum terephthalicicum JT]|uniref:tRNA 2-selenouridine(34) synthase MnmH n=1 Tax=Pelotomaculum TaxID=191373 RepID=UPI0009D3DD68|nr:MULTISPECIES: tRNA 2-selenouridine(34) synthase MnmH [Pelotomaculum]MCG9969724.1 tRNA 2-selenouridine(34) synthase MnmH [Pelotomaculum terephthalicicum JT]OPX91312.1 MAG: tRNA 2-selenouridine synthase [Pelotomaculum sp. PtaB.Bin117]OPY60648.1 MAG: tRNA 2-selenouridine synthase [Pelotomaculum sp. PtaU1.Bin065]